MFKNPLLNWLGFALVLFIATPSVSASNQTIAEEIIDLLSNQQSSEAYRLALSAQQDLEGDSQFDYAFGLAAKANGELNQAVFAFERVLQNQPNATDARVALAISYFELGNLRAAEREFSTININDVSSPLVSQMINNYLNAIEQRQQQANRQWQSLMSVGMGYDSNPNNGITDEFIDIPSLGTVGLFAESIEKSSAYADLQGQLIYVKPINQHSSLQFSGSVLHAEYADDVALDRTYATASVGYTTRYKGVDLGGSAFYRPLWLGGESLLDLYGVTVSASKPLNTNVASGVELSISQEDYANFRGFDRDQTIANLWFELSRSSGLHRLSLLLGEEQSVDNRGFLDRELYGLGYRWQQQLNQHLKYSVSLDYLDSEYQGTNPLFNVTREDQFFRSDIEVKYAMAHRLTILSKISYLTNESEIPLYEYQRFKVWVGASYEF